MRVAPTEPLSLRALGQTSSVPERFGVDFLVSHHGRWHGIQRKELSDLLASLSDGRLAKELVQMKRCDVAMLLIEGQPQWTNDGELIGNGYGQRFTLTQHRGLIFSVLARGIGVLHSSGLNDTAGLIRSYETWLKKTPKRSSLDVRPGPVNVWGNAENRDYQRHLLQGLPGVGPELADRVIERYGLPWAWTITEDDLVEIEGVGKKRAGQMMQCFKRG